MALAALTFSDIYLGESRSWLSGVPNTSDPIAAPEDCRDELIRLRQLCTDEHDLTKREEFSVKLDGVAYRASLMRSMAEDVYVMRRFPKAVPDLRQLGIHSHYVNQLLEPGLSGLIVVAGAFGQGKTTTASAIATSRISKLGGIGVTIEDPPEMPMEGEHGEGVIYQRWVEKGGFAHECRQAARWAPSIIFVGEVRDSETATEALRASLNGRLVICTIHSDSARTAIDRLYALANGSAGNSEDTAMLLSAGLKALIHQRLEPGTNGQRRLVMEFLWIGGEQEAALRNTIRNRRFDQLDSEISFQRNQLVMAGRRA